MPGQLSLMASSIYHRSTRSGQTGLIVGMIVIVLLLLGVIIFSVLEFTVMDKESSLRRRLTNMVTGEATSRSAVFEERAAIPQTREKKPPLKKQEAPLMPRVTNPDWQEFLLEKRSSSEGTFTSSTGTQQVFYKVHRTSREGRKPERHSVLLEAPIGVPLAYAEVVHGENGELEKGHARILKIVNQDLSANQTRQRSVEIFAIIEVAQGGHDFTVKQFSTGETLMHFKASAGPDGPELHSVLGPSGEGLAKFERNRSVTRVLLSQGVKPGMLLHCTIVCRLLVSPSADGI